MDFRVSADDSLESACARVRGAVVNRCCAGGPVGAVRFLVSGPRSKSLADSEWLEPLLPAGSSHFVGWRTDIFLAEGSRDQTTRVLVVVVLRESAGAPELSALLGALMFALGEDACLRALDVFPASGGSVGLLAYWSVTSCLGCGCSRFSDHRVDRDTVGSIAEVKHCISDRYLTGSGTDCLVAGLEASLRSL